MDGLPPSSKAIRLSEPSRSDETSRRGGPRLTRLADLAEALEQIRVNTREWLKRYAGVSRNDDNWPPALETSGTAPSALVTSLDEARRGLRQLRVAAEDVAKRLDEIKRTVKPGQG